MADDKPVPPLPERKENLAKKQVARGKGTFTGVPGGSGPPNRHGMPKLPPGQRSVQNWPVLDLGVLPRIELSQPCAFFAAAAFSPPPLPPCVAHATAASEAMPRSHGEGGRRFMVGF